MDLAELDVFFGEPEHLMVRYAEAYNQDLLLKGSLYSDLSIIEKWNDRPTGRLGY